MLIKLDEAIAAMLAAGYEGSQGEAIVGIGDAVDALRALPTVSDGWEDIATCPRTSKAVLLWVPERKSTFCASWRKESDPIDEYYPEGWIIFGGEWCAFLQGATHWRPLPAPPSEIVK